MENRIFPRLSIVLLVVDAMLELFRGAGQALVVSFSPTCLFFYHAVRSIPFDFVLCLYPTPSFPIISRSCSAFLRGSRRAYVPRIDVTYTYPHDNNDIVAFLWENTVGK